LNPNPALDIAAQSELSRQLEAGESLLWTGLPRQGLLLRPADVFMIPFSLMWGGFALFWEWGVLHTNAPIFMALWGIPFVAMGLYITIGRFFTDSMTRAKTCYALTDRRVLILSGLLSRSSSSLPLRTLSGVSLSERSDGSGTITFGAQNPWNSWFAGTSWPGANRYQPPSFELISDARRVQARILEAQRKAA
jgi:PH (Pleckstrin Homology) domain-containing protein